jgi:peroxiredoxin
MRALLPVIVLLGAAVAAPFLATAADPKPAPNFTLTDPTGKPWSLHDQKAKAVVVAFLSPDCPMSNGYLPTLAAIASKYAEKGVVVVGVYPDPEFTPAAIAAHVKEYRIPFPVLRDPSHAAVKALGPKVTPEVFVLDSAFAVRYRGRIDDGYVDRLRPRATVTRHDLTAALDELLAGNPVSVPETTALGCRIPELAKADPKAAGQVTFYKDVLPVLQANCQGCHRPGQVGPFSLTTYKEAARWADACVEEVKARRMPPWKPAPNPLLAGERSVPAGAVKVLEKWVAQGMPEGDPKDAPAAAAFTDDWTLGPPDVVLEMPDETTVGGEGRDVFRVIVFPTDFPEDRYITAIETKPGNPRVVHHTVQLIDTTGAARRLQAAAQEKQKADDKDRGPGYAVPMGFGFIVNPSNFVGGWAPGMQPKRLPDGVGMKLPKGSDLCVQFHYHRTGKEEKDRTKIGLYFAKGPVTEGFRSLPAAGLFREIPPGEKSFKVENVWKLTEDVTVHRLVPHMHLLGKDIELAMTTPDGKEAMLIRIPEWDYNWQEQYDLKEPLKLPKGTLLRVRATYDNSAENPNNPSAPPRPVRLGEQTTNEMCFVFVGVSTRSNALTLITPAGPLFPKGK